MNRNKKGRRFLYPDSFMKTLGHVRAYFGLGCGQTEGLIGTYHDIPAMPNHTVIHKRINKLKIQLDRPPASNVEMAVDSSGIKLTNRGEWIVRRWQKRKKGIPQDTRWRGCLPKQVLAVKVTDEY